MLRVDLRQIPPIGRPAATVSFRQVSDPAEEHRHWTAKIRASKSRLEQIVTHMPGDTLARIATRFLAAADKGEETP
jgi:hypothetical protein